MSPRAGFLIFVWQGKCCAQLEFFGSLNALGLFHTQDWRSWNLYFECWGISLFKEEKQQQQHFSPFLIGEQGCVGVCFLLVTLKVLQLISDLWSEGALHTTEGYIQPIDDSLLTTCLDKQFWKDSTLKHILSPPVTQSITNSAVLSRLVTFLKLCENNGVF